MMATVDGVADPTPLAKAASNLMPSQRTEGTPMEKPPKKSSTSLSPLLTGVVIVLLSGQSWPVESGSAIVDGHDAVPGTWPSIAALLNVNAVGRQQYCGGSLIHERWVLTAAHCLEGRAPDDVEVLLGTFSLTNGGTKIGVEAIELHPDAARLGGVLRWDVGLIRLDTASDEPVQLLLSPDDAALLDLERFEAATAGWGDTKNRPPGTPNQPDGLRTTDQTIIPDAQCQVDWGANFHTESTLCATLGPSRPCNGDSGGPLISLLDHTSPALTVQIGIMSQGVPGCIHETKSSTYARVSTSYCWIVDTIEDAGFEFVHAGLTNVGFETGDLCGWTTPTVSDQVDVHDQTWATIPWEGDWMAQLGSTYTSAPELQPQGPNVLRQCFRATHPKEEFMYNFHTFDYTGFDRFIIRLYEKDTGVVIQEFTQEAFGTSGDTSYKNTGWAPFVLHMPAHLGKVLCLELDAGGTTDSLYGTYVNIDSLANGT